MTHTQYIQLVNQVHEQQASIHHLAIAIILLGLAVLALSISNLIRG